MKGKLRLAPKTTDTKLTLADINIQWAGETTVGVSLVPILRFGGMLAIWKHLRGLYDLLETHETLNERELAFVRGAIRELAERLFSCEYPEGVFPEDDGAAAHCKIVVRERPRGKAVA